MKSTWKLWVFLLIVLLAGFVCWKVLYSRSITARFARFEYNDQYEETVAVFVLQNHSTRVIECGPGIGFGRPAYRVKQPSLDGPKASEGWITYPEVLGLPGPTLRPGEVSEYIVSLQRFSQNGLRPITTPFSVGIPVATAPPRWLVQIARLFGKSVPPSDTMLWTEIVTPRSECAVTSPSRPG